MKQDNYPTRRNCGTCHWYDALGDICRNAASDREWEHVDRHECCKKWVKDK